MYVWMDDINSFGQDGQVGVRGWMYGTDVCEYLCGQKACEVNLGHHFAAPVPFALVCVLVVFHQVPQFGASLLVRGDHRCSRAQAVRTARSPEQALCTGTACKSHTMSDNGGSCPGTQRTFSVENYCL